MAKKPSKIIKVNGRPRIFESPEHLWDCFMDYVEKEAENPWLKVDYVGQKGDKVLIPLATPVTFEGFECYLFAEGICSDLGHIASNRNNAYDNFVTIIRQIRGYCFNQNLKGAAVGAFNANLIARKLGIKDQVDSSVEVKDISDMKFSMKRRE